MPREIAIITTEYLRDFVDNVMKELQLDIDYNIYPYVSFQELHHIYQDIPDRINGIITSGSFPAEILKNCFPDNQRIIRPFNNDDAGIYKLFLQLQQQNRDLACSRIYTDIFDVAGIDQEAYLFGDETASMADKMEESISQMTLEELIKAEKYYQEKHLRLWREGKTDLSITRFSSLVSKLKEEIPIQFVYPSVDYIKTVCLRTMQDLKIKEMQGNQMAAIMITIHEFNKLKRSEADTCMEQLQKELQHFRKIYQTDLIIQKRNTGFEILTNQNTVKAITKDFHSCELQKFMKTRIEFDIYIGYGIGNDMYQARINASDANREASLHASTTSFLINEKNECIGALLADTQLVVGRTVSEPIKMASNRSGLSYLSVQKVFAAADTTKDGKITSRELAYKLSITKRSANRFLSALNEAGFAEVVEIKKSTTKGRPERIYQVKLDELGK